MPKLSRRQFFKLLGGAGAATLAGCSRPVRHLIPYVIPPEDIVPGEATWYASTCRECPAGCGMLVKNRDGHIIKVEGNPEHPVNSGRLCPRGQASVQGLYNPDRYTGPSARNAAGELVPVSWDRAERMAVERLTAAQQKGAVVFVTDLITGIEQDLVTRCVEALGGEHIIYEPIAYETLRRANRIVFGSDQIPDYRIDRADFLISFGADFLETWVSNVQFARRFAAFHAPAESGKNVFVHVGPRLSMTAANADYFVQVPPGGGMYVALGLLGSRDRTAAGISSNIGQYTPETVETQTGVEADLLRTIARRLSEAKRPLILAEGSGYQDSNALETAVAANMLCSITPGSRECIDFASPSALGRVAPLAQMKGLIDRMAEGTVAALIVYRANPVYNVPAAWGFEAAARRVPTVIALSSFPDETTALAHLIMPAHTFLESWGDYSPRKNVTGILQPAMGPLFNTRPFGDILLSAGRKMGGQAAFPENDFYEVLRASWERRRKGQGDGLSAEAFWQQSVQRGGIWQQGEKQQGHSPATNVAFTFPAPQSPPVQKRSVFDFFAYPTIRFFDGRTANRPFLREMPDPVTMVAWDGWVEINPRTAKNMAIEAGDLLELQAGDRAIVAPAFPFFGIPEKTLAMPIGHGHAVTFGRYAIDETGNPAHLLSGRLDPAGGLIRTVAPVTIRKTGRSIIMARGDGSAYQHGRKLARSISVRDYRKTRGQAPQITMPLPSGFSKERDFYPAHQHVDYRWGMVIDLDRCIGCQACVVACYAENNVGIVGKKQFSMGREMSWLHVERYFEAQQPFVRYLPMLCQHCDEAPCESMCPVFAPQHSPEGINNQVYNRCIGTRDCNQNCPWKVRRFNWFTWKHDHPLEWQLNPDVTVRQKGVMEKCSFCIQRIIHAKTVATGEGRKIKDGEFTTACAQTCPADAITFGSLMDPESRVSRLLNQARAYQVLGRLNTKPAVIYLKKITQARI